MGGRPHEFQKKIYDFFCLISPTHFAANNSCSKGPRCLKFVMRIGPPHVGPTTTFLFWNSMKIVSVSTFSKKNHFKNIIYPTHCPPYNFVQPCAWWPRRLCFSLNITKLRHAFLAIWLVEKFCQSSPVVHAAVLCRRVLRAHNLCSRGLIFFCRFTPSWGADHMNFKKIYDFFVLLVPLTLRLITHVLRVLGVWNLSCVLSPPHVGPTTTFLFWNSMKIVSVSYFFKKNHFKNIIYPTHCPPYNFVQPCAWWPRRLCFSLNPTQLRHAFLTIWLVEKFMPVVESCARSGVDPPRVLGPDYLIF